MSGYCLECGQTGGCGCKKLASSTMSEELKAASATRTVVNLRGCLPSPWLVAAPLLLIIAACVVQAVIYG